ncbi:MarR family winged helix-turn-helix transcriptional regulator [Microbacterium fluvii]|uniref:MarR family winged helix-turn-helix transcriptional regulator n=1 Tax=Microbacterium fluvii TaxID=415215 RepID=A0ABW2HDN0_9MICO|nr:MarR family transcriptional regulator [Microbacterium fluvii]MCU4673079.1 MarR family transcriptional regulator [Microbacterium fluvii]
MSAAVGVDSEAEEAILELESGMNLVFRRASIAWKESAALIHPELQPSGYKLLAHVVRMGTCNAHQLAELFDMDKSVISRQMRQLEELDLIRSVPDERDGRLRVLTPTDEARAALAHVRECNAARMRRVLETLDADEIRTCAKVFRSLAEA